MSQSWKIEGAQLVWNGGSSPEPAPAMGNAFVTRDHGVFTELVPASEIEPTEPPECPKAYIREHSAQGCVICQERTMWARESARERQQARRSAAEALDLPPLSNLAEFLAEPDPEVTYRIEGLWPSGGRVLFSAAHKTGKSTTVSNVLRSLADGDDFLGRFSTEQASRIVLLDDELDPRMLRRWLRDQEIENTEAIDLVPLRGRLSTFNILDRRSRSMWARHLGAADVLILDCLRPALDALGLDENHDAGKFLGAFEELLGEAGISEALIVHHHGHDSERARGDSVLGDKPDVLWKLVRGKDEDREARYFSAEGRDVSVPEDQLTFDAGSRRLTIGGGSRREARLSSAVEAVLSVLPVAGTGEAMSQRAVEAALDGQVTRNVVRTALQQAVADASVVTSKGPRNARLHARASGSEVPE